MPQEKRQITEVIIVLKVTGANDGPAKATGVDQSNVKVQDKDVELEVRFQEGKPEVTKWHDWRTAARQACLMATQADMDSFQTAFVLGPDEKHWITVYVPASFMKGEEIGGPPMLQVAKQLGHMGFECDAIGSGMWVLHRPDPRDAYSKRGYFDSAQLVRFASTDSKQVDKAIGVFWTTHSEVSEYTGYLSLRGERRMATKKEAAEETARKQTTVKALDGTEVPVSPKQEEVLMQIRERSAGGSPLGSDDERLSDPDSIAAMKLATGEHPIVVRGKFGTRWHYFAKQTDLDKATKAAENTAAQEKATKAASKKPAKAESAGETAGSSKKKGGPLKKPSEK